MFLAATRTRERTETEKDTWQILHNNSRRDFSPCKARFCGTVERKEEDLKRTCQALGRRELGQSRVIGTKRFLTRLDEE